MHVIDADKMLADTSAMNKYVAEAISCDGIITYLQTHCFSAEAVPISINDKVYRVASRQQQVSNTTGKTGAIERVIEELKVRSITMTCNSKGIWKKSFCAAIDEGGKITDNLNWYSFDAIGQEVFKDKQEAERQLRH